MSGLEDDGMCEDMGHEYGEEIHQDFLGEPYSVAICAYCGHNEDDDE